MRFPLAAGLAAALIASPAAALTCSVDGDSIAKGVGAYLPGCVKHAVVGIPASRIVPLITRGVDVVVISAGSNLPNATEKANLPAYLAAIRARVTGRAIWLQPSDASPLTRQAVAPVRAIATRYGDPVVTFTPGRDRVHPANYLTVARAVAARM